MDLDARIGELQRQRRQVLGEIQRAKAAIALLDAPTAKKQAGSTHEERANALLQELERLLLPLRKRVAVLPIGQEAEAQQPFITEACEAENEQQNKPSAPEEPQSSFSSFDEPENIPTAPAPKKARKTRRKTRK